MERIRQTTQSELAAHTVKIIRAEIEHLPYAGRPIVIGPDNLEALANEYDSAIAFRATVAAALEELRADFLKARDLHSVAASDKDYEGEYETGMRLSAAAVAWQDATNRLDATIAKLGLGGIPNCPDCGNNRQVWVNQITGKMTCHRAGCHKEI